MIYDAPCSLPGAGFAHLPIYGLEVLGFVSRGDGQELAPAETGGAFASKHGNASQTCVCANRILMQDVIYKRLAETAGTKVADGFEPDTVIGRGSRVDDNIATIALYCTTANRGCDRMRRGAWLWLYCKGG